MQSFYGNFVAVPEGTAGGFCSGGSRSSSCPPARLGAVSTGGDRHSFYDSFWPKAKVAPPIFVSSVGRTESALALDRRLRACEAIPALVALLSELTHFDVGNVVIALSSGAKIADERTLLTLRFGYPAWSALLSRVHECIPVLEPRGLAMVAHSAAKLGWRDEQLARELSAAAAAKVQVLSSTDLAKICWAMSKLDLVENFEDLWQLLEKTTIRRAAEAKSVDLSMIAWAFGNACRGSQELCKEISVAARRLLDDLTTQCLANIAWVCARLEAPNRELCDAIIQKAKTMVAEFTELDVSRLCWALAKLEATDVELFESLADHAVQMGFVRRFSAQMASQLAWAFAAAKVVHVPLLEALSGYVAKHLHVMEPEQVASCAWAFGSFEALTPFSEPGLVASFISISRGGKLLNFQADEFCALAWAFAKLGLDDQELLQDLLQVSLKRAPEVDSTSLINLLGSLVALCFDGSDVLKKDFPCILEIALQRFTAESLSPNELHSVCHSLCRAGCLTDAMHLAEANDSDARLLGLFLGTAERIGSETGPFWSRLADFASTGPLRAVCLWAQSPESVLSCEMGEEDSEKGELFELGRLLSEVVQHEQSGADILQCVEEFGSSCKSLDVCLGTREAVLDELASQQPQLTLVLGGWSAGLRLAARAQEYSGHVVTLHQDPFHTAVARYITKKAGLSGSLQHMLGDLEDVLEKLLESYGESSVDMVLLQGGTDNDYLTQLQRAHKLRLWTSGRVVADHLLRKGSPLFLWTCAPHKLELVQVTDHQGADWMGLCHLPTLECPSTSGWISGLASLVTESRSAWRVQRLLHGSSGTTGHLQEKMIAFASQLGLQPSARLQGVSKRPLPVCEVGLSVAPQKVKVEQKVQESTEAKVAQGYLRTLDFKRWLTSVDPTGGCLEYLPAMQIHGTLEQIMETYLQASETTSSRILRDEFFTEHQVRQEHRIRFQRWFKDSCGAEEAQPCANPATLVTKEDTEIDLKRLSFSDWLASIDPSMALQQYLPCIQESYDTVSQIATTYTILKNGGQEKTLDLQLFDDFGVVDDEHQALFRNWFARFCGVREMADGDSLSTEDPSTPHFGPEGEVQTGTASNLPGNCSEEVKETATEVPSEKDAKVPAVALDAKMVQEEALSSPVKQLQREGHEANQQVEEVAQLVEAEHPPPGGQSPPQGNAFFDFDDLSAEPTLQKTELAENQARDGSGGMFDFDELEEIAPSAAGLKLPGDVAKEQVQEEVQAEDTKGQAVEEAGQDEQKEEMTEDTAKENDEADGNTKDDSKERIPEVEMEASNLLHQFDESIIPGNTDESGEQPAQNPETWGADVDHVETGRGGFFDFDDLDEAEAG